MRRSRALTLAAVLGVALPTVLAAAPASAKPIERGEFHDEFTDVFTDFCDVPGLTVDYEAVVDGTYRWNSHGAEGIPYYVEHLHITQVFTNPDTELSVRTTESTLSKDLSIDREGDILTIVILATGNFTMYGPDGKAIARNPGQVRFRLVIDDNGTLTDPSDDIELSFELIKGSTGRSDDFCEAIVPAIQ